MNTWQLPQSHGVICQVHFGQVPSFLRSFRLCLERTHPREAAGGRWRRTSRRQQSTAALGTLTLRTSFLTSFLGPWQLQHQHSSSQGAGGPTEDNLGSPALGLALPPPPPALRAEQRLLEEQGAEEWRAWGSSPALSFKREIQARNKWDKKGIRCTLVRWRGHLQDAAAEKRGQR